METDSPHPRHSPIDYATQLYGESKNCDCLEFVNEDCYFEDFNVPRSFEEAVKILREAGPIFNDREKRRVGFGALDWDVQSGMITTMTRYIQKREGFLRVKPRRKWMNHESGTSGEVQGSAVESCRMTEGEASMGASMSDVPTSRPNFLDQRKDSKRDSTLGSEQPQITWHDKSVQTTTPSHTHDSNRRSPRKHRSIPYETITPVDDSHTLFRRKIIGVEESWHPSKSRVSPTLKELGCLDKILHGPRLSKIGSARSTLSKGRVIRGSAIRRV